MYDWKISEMIIDLGSKFTEKNTTTYAESTKLVKLRDSLVIDIQHRVSAHFSRSWHTLL